MKVEKKLYFCLLKDSMVGEIIRVLKTQNISIKWGALELAHYICEVISASHNVVNI